MVHTGQLSLRNAGFVSNQTLNTFIYTKRHLYNPDVQFHRTNWKTWLQVASEEVVRTEA